MMLLPDLRHDAHIDYQNEGHLHDVHSNRVDEDTLEVGTNNQDRCTPDHECAAPQADHAAKVGMRS